MRRGQAIFCPVFAQSARKLASPLSVSGWLNSERSTAGGSGSIAAFIAEPIQGVGGFITPPKEYFKIVFSIVKKYGGLFIFDEVPTRWGSTGKKWVGIQRWEVTPGILTSAKGMANGVPVVSRSPLRKSPQAFKA